MFELLDKIEAATAPADCEYFASKTYEGLKSYACSRENGYCLSPDCQECGPLLNYPAYENDADYQVGKIMSASWGHEQTNIDWYVITKRTAKMVTLQPIGGIKEETQWMAGKCMPNPAEVLDKKPIRRKLAVRDNKIIGCSFDSSYGWISAWDGQPEHYSSYA